MSVYGKTRKLYARLVPGSLRHRLYLWTPPPLKRARHEFLEWASRGAEHDEIYDSEYYAKIVEPTILQSVDPIADTITILFQPRTVVDVGCGTGALIEALGRKGIVGLGLEYAQAAIDICRAKSLDVRKFDIEADLAPGLTADVVISTEVAEHLPERCADRFVDLLVSIAPRVVLTAAEPGIGVVGTDHVNEQPNEYWIEKFKQRNYTLLREQSEETRKRWRSLRVAGCYCRSLMIFERTSAEGGVG